MSKRKCRGASGRAKKRPNRRRRPKCPKTKNIEAALQRHFASIAASIVETTDSNRLYKVEDSFGIAADYWKDKVRPDRFNRRDLNILYRPKVTDALFEKVKETFANYPRTGVIVTGPQGIGKSYSLVNLVHKLQSTGDYLVTFFPDCNRWDTADDFLEMVCDSFGVKLRGRKGIGLGDIIPGVPAFREADLHTIIEAIAREVVKQGKQWVFVFDEVDGLFGRGCDVDSISELTYPFYMVDQVQEYGAISIISAAANDETAFHHTTFREFSHTADMTSDELLALFGPDAEKDIVKETAGTNPFYVKKVLANPEGFLHAVYEEVAESTFRLRAATADWPPALDSIMWSVLSIVRDSVGDYYKKYLVPKRSHEGWLYTPIVPAVLAAFRRFLWLKIMDYIAREERQLLNVCASPLTTDETRGQIFKHIVFQRIESKGLTFDCSGASIELISGCCFHLTGSRLPSLIDTPSNVMFVPDSSVFPTIDFFVRSETIIVGFQTHVGKHTDISQRFLKMCRQAGWFSDSITEVVLIFLSPSESTKQQASDLIQVECMEGVADSGNGSVGKIRQAAYCCLDFPDLCLSTMPWPHRSSGLTFG
jgi:AAA domain